MGREVPFPFDQIAALSTALLSPAYKINNRTRGGLGRVCTPLHGHIKFSEIFNQNFCYMKSAQGDECDQDEFTNAITNVLEPMVYAYVMITLS